MDLQYIFQKIEERKEELFQLLSSLVKIDSQNFSSHGNEKEVATNEYQENICAI